MTAKPGNRWHVGPLVIAAGVMAGCWLAIAVVLFRQATSPALVLLGGLAAALGAVLVVVALRMVVQVGPGEVRVLGRPGLALEAVEGIAVSRVPGTLPIFVPVVLARRGRALVTLELDGLSSFPGDEGARRRASSLAAATGCGEVTEVALPGHAAARRRQDA